MSVKKNYNIINLIDYEYDEEEIYNYIKYIQKEVNNKKFSIVFCDNKYIQELNNEFRQINKPTDVLSFEENLDDYLGDVIISIEKMKEQAKEYNHSEKRELYFLITHGFLHLNGYDHKTKDEEKEMFFLQNKLLENYNITR